MIYSTSVVSNLGPDAIFAQMERILASRSFAASGQLSRLLRFSVREALAGNHDALKESVLGVEVFGREPGFDTRTENVVRVAESRLRDRLRQYYEKDGAADPILIILEKGSYVPQFRPHPGQPAIPPATVQPSPKPREPRARWATAAFCLLVVLSASWWLFGGVAPQLQPSLKVIPLTTYPGVEEYPAFSPDGSRVAFTWTGEKQDQVDLYVKVIGTESPLRLTRTPEPECCLAWSPDGRWISFLRCPAGDQCPPGNGRQDVVVISALGGPERHIGSIYPAVNRPYPAQTWTPDGKWLIVSDKNTPSEKYALVLLSVESGEKRPLITPPSDDSAPAISPDGKALAFVRGTQNIGFGLYLANLTEIWTSQGPPRLRTRGDPTLEDPMWSADSNYLYFTSPGSSRYPSRSLWRVAASGEDNALRVTEVGQIGREAALSQDGDRMAYTDAQNNTSIWRLDLTDSSNSPARFISSTRADYNARFSPDGKRIAYASNRLGDMEIWLCDSNGGSPVQLTQMARGPIGTPRWSPDGSQIAFDRLNLGIYVVGAEGGKPRSVTTSDASASTPSWSHDGRWIYFASNRSGELQVWRVPAGGGDPVQVTKGGGHSGFESTDGRFLYYAKSPVATSLWRVPVSGGEETMVSPSLLTRMHMAPTEEGLYFVERPTPDGAKPVKFLQFATGAIETVTSLHQELDIGLSVSPDRHWMLFSAVEVRYGDLMMVEGLRNLFHRRSAVFPFVAH